MPGWQNQQRRIAITGLGIVCSVGRTPERVWESLTATTASDCEAAGQRGVADFSGTIDDFGELPASKRKLIRKSLKVMNRETQMGVAAGQQALQDSDALEQYTSDRFGVVFGSDNVSILPDDFTRAIEACSTSGEYDIDRWGSDGIEEMAPLWLLKCLPNMPACHLAIINDLQGPSNTITQRDLSANLAIAEACRTIRAGDTDAALVGATGTTLTAFNLIHAQLDHEVEAGDAVCRPFDRRRRGSAPGEGAAAIVLEDLDVAIRRGARVYGEILGAAAAASIGAGGTGCCRTAVCAIHSSGADVGPKNSGFDWPYPRRTVWERFSPTSTKRRRCAKIFGDMTDHTPIVAARSHLSHTAAAAGALDLVTSLLALQAGHLFPVRNFRMPDPECPVRPTVGNHEPAGDSFLNVSLVNRGLASCVAVSAWAA